MRQAKWWTLQHCAVSLTSEARLRRPRRIRSWWTAPTASSGGTCAVSGVAAAVRSLRTTTSAPSRTAAAASRQMRSTASRRPHGPLATSYAVETRAVGRPSAGSASVSAPFSTGDGRSTRCACSGPAVSRSPRGPSLTASDITSRSRSGSMAGLVTWAKRSVK